MENPNKTSVVDLVVKHSEPTLVPPALETNKGLLFLSNLDQDTIIIQSIHSFKSEEKGSEKAAETIKQALAKVLVPYYPLAGRLMLTSEGKYVVNCTGEGVLFVEAEGNFELEEMGDVVLLEPQHLEKLCCKILSAQNPIGCPLLVAQVTKFRCGGFVMGISFNHCIMDGHACAEFMNSWGETARNLPLSVPPFLDRTLLKPRTPLQVSFPHHEFDDIDDISDTSNQPLTNTHFLFDHHKLTRLKHKSMQTCTTFEVLAAFVWKTRTQALGLNPNQPIKLIVVVDGRTRLKPHLPEKYFGNAIMITGASCTAGELIGRSLSFALELVRNVVRKVDNEYVRSEIDFLEKREIKGIETGKFVITTWCKLPFGSVDFGWGTPLRTGPVCRPTKMVCHFDSYGEDKRGVVVFLSLPRDVAPVFKSLIEYV